MKLIKKITRHTLKFFVIPLAALCVVCAGSAAALFYFYPKDKVLTIVTSSAEKMLKRKVTAGDIRYSLRGVEVSRVVILNSMDPADQPLIQVGSIGLKFNLLSLLHNKFELSDLEINDLDLVLSYKDGKWNLQSLLDDIRSGKSEGGVTTTLKTIGFENASIRLQSSPEFIRHLIGKYLWSGTVDISQTDAVIFRDFTLTLPETRGELESSAITVSPLSKAFAVTGDVQLNSAEMGWLYTWGGLDFLPYDTVTGKITGVRVTANDLGGRFVGTGRMRNKSAVTLNGAFKANISPFLLTISDAQIKTGRSSAHIRSLTAGNNRLPSFSVGAIDARVEEITPMIPYFPNGLFGHIGGELSADQLVFTGKLVLEDVGFDRQNNVLSSVNGSFTVVRNSLHAENIPAKVLSNNAVISVAAPENLMKEIAVSLRFDTLDFSKKDGGDVKSNAPALAIPALPIRIRGLLEVGRLKKDNLDFKNIECSYDVSGKSLSLPRMKFDFLDASVAGSATADLSGKTPVVDVKMTFDNLKIQNLSALEKELAGRLFGNAKGRVAVSFNPLADNPAETISGTCYVAVTNGKVANTGIQDALGVWLDPLKYKLKDLEFNTISGNFLMDKGNVSVKTLIFNSPDIRVMVDGDVSSQKDLNAKLVLEFTNTFIQDLPNPALIRLNNYKKGKWFTINLTAKGNIPKGKYDVNESK